MVSYELHSDCALLGHVADFTQCLVAVDFVVIEGRMDFGIEARSCAFMIADPQFQGEVVPQWEKFVKSPVVTHTPRHQGNCERCDAQYSARPLLTIASEIEK